MKENDLVHGEWGKWCESIGFPASTARKFIKVAEELPTNRSTSNTLGLDALYLIATMPEHDREKEHTLSNGETKKPEYLPRTKSFHMQMKTLKNIYEEGKKYQTLIFPTWEK